MQTPPKKIILSFAHALLLVGLTIALQYTGNVKIDETAFFKWFSVARHNILHLDRKPVGDSLVLLDVSKDLELVEDTGLNVGNIAITNRATLANVFSVLNKHKGEYKLVVCDVGFNYPSDNDSLLRPAIENARDVFIALSLKGGHPLKPLFKGNYGATDYTVNSGDFVKYPLFYDDTIKSLPLKMVEGSGGNRFSRNKGLTYENDKLIFNTIIPEFYYRNADIIADSLGPNKGKKPNLIHIGELPAGDFFDKYLKNKYILIGDFCTDKHSTYLGEMPGPLIVFDAYLTLRQRSLAISWGWMAILFVAYFLISWNIFVAPLADPGKFEKKIEISFVREFVMKLFSYLFVLLLLNLVSYIFFGFFISLFYVGTYLSFVHAVVKKVAVFRKSRKLRDIFKD